MATTTTRLVTVEEFRKLPEEDGFYSELRRGEVRSLTRPKYRHYSIQRRLRRLLENLAPSNGLVDTEFVFRAVAEYELRVADVVYVSGERERSIDPDDNLHGAPDIVIEVLSPSNTPEEISEKKKLCLENGCQEFWVVDPRLRQVLVSTADGCTVTWSSGQQIPLPLFGGATLALDEIFDQART
jgi:Uma2 family endonuclease